MIELLTTKDAKLPRVVMLGCDAVSKVPVIPPDTDRLPKVPTEVING